MAIDPNILGMVASLTKSKGRMVPERAYVLGCGFFIIKLNAPEIFFKGNT